MKRKIQKKINYFKKYSAVFLIILLMINMFAIAVNLIDIIIFWFNLGILATISYAFYKDK